VSDEAAAGILLVVAVLLAKLVASGRYLDYVRPATGPILTATAGVLAIAGLVVAYRSASRRPGYGKEAAFAGHGHARQTVSRAGWLLVVQIALLGAVPAAPLGSFAATLAQSSARPPPARSLFPALPARSHGPVPMSLSDFVSRALYDPAASLRGFRVRLVGFVGPRAEGGGDGFDLIRFAIYCCAADAVALRVQVVGDGTAPRPPPPDTWLAVTGVWRPAPPRPPGPFDSRDAPVLEAISVVRIDPPSNPYDSPQ
jgi:uncharacterized repeat protein (TIGR03943 family)